MLNRVLYSNNGVITDLSRDLERYRVDSSTIAGLVAAEDYIYLGARLPFNHFYVKLTTANINANTLTCALWDGRAWIDTFETVDETEGFTQSGFIYFVPDKDTGWTRESTNDDGEQITGLTTVKIHDLYWLRIKASADWSNTVIKWIGQKFSDDNDLISEFPDLVRSAMLTSFETGKTDWEEQHIKAAEIIAQDLISSDIIDFKEQILIKEEFRLASVQKVAEIIYTSFGDDYAVRKDNARIEYRRRMEKSIYRVDKNANAILNQNEQSARQGFLNR